MKHLLCTKHYSRLGIASWRVFEERGEPAPPADNAAPMEYAQGAHQRERWDRTNSHNESGYWIMSTFAFRVKRYWFLYLTLKWGGHKSSVSIIFSRNPCKFLWLISYPHPIPKPTATALIRLQNCWHRILAAWTPTQDIQIIIREKAR